jgi:hypothetical protein
MLNWFSELNLFAVIASTWAGPILVAVVLDRILRFVKRLRGKTLSWSEVEHFLNLERGTLIYMDPGVFGSAWWTPDEGPLNGLDAREHAVLVRCPWRFRNAGGLVKAFPKARVATFDTSAAFD